MKVKFHEDVRIFIACGQMDMRKSIDGLAAIVSETLKLDFPECAVSLLRKKKRLGESVVLGGDGFLILYKRLENGSFQWTRSNDEGKEIAPQQYRWLLVMSLSPQGV